MIRGLLNCLLRHQNLHESCQCVLIRLAYHQKQIHNKDMIVFLLTYYNIPYLIIKSGVVLENLIIREATEKDIPIILSLLYELGRPKPQQDSDLDYFRKLVKQYITNSDKKIFVAILNDIEIVGVVSIVLMSRLNRTSLELYIPELVVLEKHHNQGIGKLLINKCIEFGKQKNCHRIRLESGNQRKDSHEFYKHLGFEQSALTFTMNL